MVQGSHLRDGSLKHVVAHRESRRVDGGHDDDDGGGGTVWTSRSSGVFGKVEGDVDPTEVKEGQRFKVTCRK